MTRDEKGLRAPPSTLFYSNTHIYASLSPNTLNLYNLIFIKKVGFSTLKKTKGFYDQLTPPRQPMDGNDRRRDCLHHFSDFVCRRRNPPNLSKSRGR
jgi:hypothetical protein